MSDFQTAILALEDGSVYKGRAFGAKKTVVGEAVFNTSMTGYQEVLTDPSYFGQIVTMTAVEIGNYGVNKADEESDGIKVRGFVVREVSPISSSWRAEQTIQEYLEQGGVPAISGVDTRAITKKLRSVGAMKACLSTEGISAEEAVAKARGWAGLVGVDYVREVSRKTPCKFDWSDEMLKPFTVEGTSLYKFERTTPVFKCAAIDYGAKTSIFKKLAFHGFDVTIFPADAPAEQIEEFAPDAVFLSNGPGDPSAVSYAHKCVSRLIKKYPTFGICLGHQIITHAIGAKTYKLKFGHRGGNQPVKNLETGIVSITSQNHGFAADAKSIENAGGIVTEINLNDETVEGLRLKDYPVFSVQYHPEAAPGPNDADPLFENFHELVKKTLGK
ncbi:MAG: glutamine-hydrolyzing carbamoyl-phosphate synthase small subunit [Candidatus Merdousia sp.]|nr:glutamine-hydrolyzing carbamoyl-phosphate synthase small subunit [Candidatus Merdousia sp.]